MKHVRYETGFWFCKMILLTLVYLVYLQFTSSFMTRIIGFWASIFVARHWRRAPMSCRVGASTRTRLSTDKREASDSKDTAFFLSDEEEEKDDRSSLSVLAAEWLLPVFAFSEKNPSTPPGAILGAFRFNCCCCCCSFLVPATFSRIALSWRRSTSSPVAVRRMSTRSGINLRLLRCQETVASGLPGEKREREKKE